MKTLRQLLLRSDRIKRIVSDYQWRKKKQRHHQRWQMLLRSGGRLR
ncbi:hypothetical protein [Desulfosporosinus acididurans]|nr:hypothetical protein [Desulfosporosinus acididurans]